MFFLIMEWSPDFLISEGYTSYPGQHNIACDANGGVHATWFKYHGGTRYSVWYQYYTGTQWIDLKKMSGPFHGGNTFASYPSIASSADGNRIYVVWENWWGYSEIVLRRFYAGNWEDSVIYVSTGVRHTYSPSAALDMDGVLHIVYEKEYEIHYRKLDGNELSADTVLSNSGVYAAYPGIATFNHKVFVVWEDLRDGNFEIYFKEFDGTQWGDDRKVTNSACASLFPSLCVDSSGAVHIVWQEDEIGGFNIWYSKYEQGNFSNPSLVVDSPSEAITPSIAGVGVEVHFVWSDSRDGDWEIYYKNIPHHPDDIKLTYSPGISANPSICADSDGNLYLLFWDTRTLPAKVYFKEKTGSKESRSPELELTISPNPFRTKTVIEFRNFGVQELRESELEIYDLAGRVVKTFSITNYQLPITNVTWDGRDDRGVRLNSGIYFVKTEIPKPKTIIVKKIILLR